MFLEEGAEYDVDEERPLILAYVAHEDESGTQKMRLSSNYFQPSLPILPFLR